MKKIFSFLGANPKLIIIAIVAIVVISFGVWISNTIRENGRLTDQVAVLEKDTLQKGFQIRSLKIDTAYYVNALRDSKAKIDSLRALDARLNPGLIDRLPSLDKIKRL